MAGKPGPEESVGGPEPGSAGRAGENEKLVAEGEVLQHEVTPDAQGAAQRGAEDQEIGDQGRASFRDGCPQTASNGRR